ncbi:hypothetical protein BAUCODRAFT_395914 [Baudoinia panamericana UAMH 10762]|uniref:Uncharacterized protein n=1 Tax=Baudoinia panamericana (strain UAMH 10762) TaxID=717646 RepID=M2N5D5_BAUPA|nr:uncharacterized protein BAUCODRAFT_395914 [Baudoinia panamericana UAMH 10762]EMC99243.1 hypothetical protein BAUCODRAFT_395914 [Baudoinia panamericana UAMH 10762]
MSMDAGGLAHMTYNNSPNGFPAGGLGVPGAGFGNRSRLSNKRLSVALPPRVNPIQENLVDNPTPRTSRSHLLAGLRTQPKQTNVPASAPYHQTEHQVQGLGASRWANPAYNNGYGQNVPQTATGTGFNLANQYAMSAGQQMYALPEQVMAPPNLYDQMEDVDPAVLQQMQMTSLYLAQRKEQLQQQLASLTAATQGISLNTNMQHASFQAPMTPQTPTNYYPQQQQQQLMSPIEVQPGLFLMYNPAIQGYSYVMDQSAQQQQMQTSMSPIQHGQATAFSPAAYEPPTPSVQISPPGTERSTPTNGRSFTPPKKAPSPPSTLEHVEPLPPPSANAFRRGHKKAVSSLSINPNGIVTDGPKTASAAMFGAQRGIYPPTPATGTFGPGAARAGEHPLRQPRGPPPLEQLTVAPTSKHEGSKNFATRQRRRALDSLMKAGTSRRAVSRSSNGTPLSESDFNLSVAEDVEDIISVSSAGSRKMSPIGSEMKEKRGSQGSADGYFGLTCSSASSSESEEMGAFKQPLTPVTPGDRKQMMLGVLSAAEKRKSFVF